MRPFSTFFWWYKFSSSPNLQYFHATRPLQLLSALVQGTQCNLRNFIWLMWSRAKRNKHKGVICWILNKCQKFQYSDSSFGESPTYSGRHLKNLSSLTYIQIMIQKDFIKRLRLLASHFHLQWAREALILSMPLQRCDFTENFPCLVALNIQNLVVQYLANTGLY